MGVTRDLSSFLVPAESPTAGAVMRQGEVSVVNSDGTVTLTLGGSVTAVTSVRCLANVMPYVGATVWCAQFARDLLVVGVQEVATGWSTSTTGFTAAANWSLTSVRWRRVGSLAWLYVVLARTTSNLAVAAGTGDITNTDILSAVPANMTPASVQYGHSGGTGRVATYSLSSGGVMTVNALAGDGTVVSFTGPQDSISAQFNAYPID